MDSTQEWVGNRAAVAGAAFGHRATTPTRVFVTVAHLIGSPTWPSSGGNYIRPPVKLTHMSNGMGVAFGGVVLVVVLAGMAALLSLSLAVTLAARRRTEGIPDNLRNLSVAVVVGVALIAGFGLVALFDEAATLAAVFLVSALIPLGVVGVYLHQMTEFSRIDTIAMTGLAWSFPFLLGLAVTFGIPPTINSVFGLAPGESRDLGVYWLATGAGAIVVELGALWLGLFVSTSMQSSPATR